MKIKAHNGDFEVDRLPDECPYCHNKIRPVPVFMIFNKHNGELMLVCPFEKCRKSFIAYYSKTNGLYSYLNKTTIGTLNKKEFTDRINEISQSFSEIYNESYSAEQMDLFEICGVGYRKSLEFLIKDYISIGKNDEETETIKKSSLASCIENYVTDTKIKSVAKRASWLGNDETHYYRKWKDKSLEDLKKLIELTVHWIEMEELTKSFEVDMPDKKK